MRRRFRIPWQAATTVLILLYIFMPLLVAALYSFNSASSLRWPIEGLSLRWYATLFDDALFRSAFQLSVEAAFVSAFFSVSIGTAAAFVFSRRRSRVARSASALARLPVMLPPLFIGIGLVALMSATDFAPSFLTIVVGHTVVILPFVVMVVMARLQTFEIELEEAARDLGATPIQVLRRVTLPIILPALLGAALLAFAFSFDEILVTTFTSGSRSTVPIYILGKLRRSVDPSANAVAVILLLVPWIAFGLSAIFLRRTGGGIGAILGSRGR